MASTDGVFDEGTFDNATFNNISRGESFTVSDSVEKTDASFFRSFSENVVVNDSDIKQLERTVSESFSVSDSSSKKFFTSISESLSVSENLSISFFKSLSEAVNLLDNVVKEAEVYRALSETVSMQDSTSKKVFKIVSESITISDNFTYGSTISGTVTLDGSAVQGADVYAWNKTEGVFLGHDTTDASGDYLIDTVVDEGEIALIAVDYEDSGEFFGDEKSTVV